MQDKKTLVELRKSLIIFFFFSPILIVAIVVISNHDFLDDGIDTGIIANPKLDTLCISGRITSFKTYKGEVALRINSTREQIRFIAHPNSSNSIVSTGIGSWIEVGDSIYKARSEDSIHLFKKVGIYSWALK